MSAPLHLILGAGPVGTWIANALVERDARVRVVCRSGRRPALLAEGVEVAAADLSDQSRATAAAEGAAVVYQAMNPPYHRWHEQFPGLQAAALAAACAAGARYVSIDNLYMYDASDGPIREDTRIAPRSRKGELRARMAAEVLAARERGAVRAAILRSSDYYGPGVLASALGDRVFPPILARKPGEALGALDMPHSYAYIEDVGRAAVELGSREEALGGVWIAPHAPAVTQREVLDRVFATIGATPRYRTVGRGTLRFAGLFSPGAREMVEMTYEFTEPFIVDSGRIEDAFGILPTPFEEGLARTVDWYRGTGGRG